MAELESAEQRAAREQELAEAALERRAAEEAAVLQHLLQHLS